MPLQVHEAYPSLWHYTTASGLDGILKSQQLWATNFRHLNDHEELQGFFQRKLPTLLQDGIEMGVAEVIATPRGKEMLKEAGDVGGIKGRFFKGLHEALTTVTLGLEVYVTSFCYTNPGPDSRDGLLSQWRGYGQDGGYAIVFDSVALNDLLLKEREKYAHPFINFGDVDYHDDGWKTDHARYEETLIWEQSVREITSRVVVDGDLQTKAEELFTPIVALATRHKHQGFREEQEVRIAVVRLPKKMLDEAPDGVPLPPKKRVSFYPRSGVLVPYISLFDGIPVEERKLPIKEIIVGPHQDKLRRQQSLQLLLEELGIDAEVKVSDIPFLGR